MSKTLEMIIKHLTKDAVEQITKGGKSLTYLDFPFDLEAFCIENDEQLELLRSIKSSFEDRQQ